MRHAHGGGTQSRTWGGIKDKAGEAPPHLPKKCPHQESLPTESELAICRCSFLSTQPGVENVANSHAAEHRVALRERSLVVQAYCTRVGTRKGEGGRAREGGGEFYFLFFIANNQHGRFIELGWIYWYELFQKLEKSRDLRKSVVALVHTGYELELIRYCKLFGSYTSSSCWCSYSH
jgi:hypothetical protein